MFPDFLQWKEKCLCFLSSYSLLNPVQPGFYFHHSSEAALSWIFLSYILPYLSMAFNIVDLSLLLETFSFLGFQNPTFGCQRKLKFFMSKTHDLSAKPDPLLMFLTSLDDTIYSV